MNSWPIECTIVKPNDVAHEGYVNPKQVNVYPLFFIFVTCLANGDKAGTVIIDKKSDRRVYASWHVVRL